jgi:hypothetical protein
VKPGDLVVPFCSGADGFILIFDSPGHVDLTKGNPLRVDAGSIGLVLGVTRIWAGSLMARVLFGDRAGWTYSPRLKRV